MLFRSKGEIDSNTIIVGDFNTPLSPMLTSSKMKINKEIQALNDTLNKMDLIDIYRTFHPKTTVHILLKCTWNILNDRSYARTQKSLNKFQKPEIISSLFSDHSGIYN